MNADDEYSVFADPEVVAEAKGLVCVLPKTNQLQIDIDSQEQFEEFTRRYSAVNGTEMFGTGTKVVRESNSRYPNCHITITVEGKEFTDAERIMWQAVLGDDPLRTFLNGVRYAHGSGLGCKPCRLFEVP